MYHNNVFPLPNLFNDTNRISTDSISTIFDVSDILYRKKMQSSLFEDLFKCSINDTSYKFQVSETNQFALLFLIKYSSSVIPRIILRLYWPISDISQLRNVLVDPYYVILPDFRHVDTLTKDIITGDPDVDYIKTINIQNMSNEERFFHSVNNGSEYINHMIEFNDMCINNPNEYYPHIIKYEAEYSNELNNILPVVLNLLRGNDVY